MSSKNVQQYSLVGVKSGSPPQRSQVTLRRALAQAVGIVCIAAIAAAQQRPRIIFPKGAGSSRVAATIRRLTSNNLLQYYGGPVISNVQVIAVFWSSAVDSGEQSNAPGFYAAVTNSPWMNLMAQYSTNGLTGVAGSPGSNQTIGSGSFINSYTITPANTNTTLSDADIQTELAHQVNIGALPAPALDAGGFPNTLYMIYFPLSVTISDPNIGTSCQTFCAYHSTLTLNSELVAYGVIPDLSPSSACASGCGGDANYINNLDSVCSHELAESITDPAVGVVTAFDSPLGWYDSNPNDPFGGGEIGDLCLAMEDTTTGGGQTYTVQQLWSNFDGACVAASGGSATVTTLTSSAPGEAKFGKPITFTATVKSGGLAVSSGMVQFMDGTKTLAMSSLDGSGNAVYSGGLTVGRHTITANFLSTNSLLPSSMSIVQLRSPRPGIK